MLLQKILSLISLQFQKYFGYKRKYYIYNTHHTKYQSSHVHYEIQGLINCLLLTKDHRDTSFVNFLPPNRFRFVYNHCWSPAVMFFTDAFNFINLISNRHKMSTPNFKLSVIVLSNFPLCQHSIASNVAVLHSRF